MIIVKYSCHACGTRKADVSVRHRNALEDIVHWMKEAVIVAVRDDHLRRSPACRSQACDLMLPIENGAAQIGGPVQH